MKKILLIFGLVALVGVIGFTVSVRALGVKDNNYSLSIGGQKFMSPVSFGDIPLSVGDGKVRFTDGSDVKEYDTKSNELYSYEFRSGIPNDISIEVITADTTIEYGDVEYVKVEYKTGSGSNSGIKAKLSDGKLTVTEEQSASFGFTLASLPELTALTVTLPERTYGDIKVSNMSGSVKAESVECKDLDVKIMSGDAEYSVYADDISVEMTSGDLTIKNCTDKRPNELSIKTLSGTVIVSGFTAKETEFSSASGKIEADSLGGDVTLKSTSGTANLNFAEWTGDLTVKKTSGSTDVRLPSGAGIDLKVSCSSGGVDVTYNGDTDRYGDDEDDVIGGSNVHEVNVSITSGKVNIDIAK